MDTNENNFSEEETFGREEFVSQSDETRQKERTGSPFADTPYEVNFSQTNTYRYASPEIPKKKRKPSGKVWKGIGAAVLAVALAAGSCGITAAVMNARMEKMTEAFRSELDSIRSQVPGQTVTVVPSSNPAADGTYTPAQVYEMCKRSVVGITNQFTTRNDMDMFPFGGSGTSTAVSTGSGFVLSDAGYIVTNYHVIEGNGKLKVTLYNGSEYEAQLIGGDEDLDIALLKIEAEGLYPVTVGSSDTLLIGDQVVAIGNPLGELTSTQTVGYISGKDREVSTDGTVMTMLQTDAAINSGNSGGPLFNMYGQVVGITTAKYSGTSNSGASIEGIGFAIPISDVIERFDEIKELGYVSSAYLGVMVKDMDSATASMYQLPLGAYIESVTEGSCAEKGGMQAADILIELDGSKVESVNDLSLVLRKKKPGDTVTAVVYRAGAKVSLTLVLDEKPQQTEPTMPSEGSYDDWYKYFAPYFGNGMG